MLLTPDELIARYDCKFYRLTNKDECHRGFQYKTGLNVDTIPFNPAGTCEPGGLYFFSVWQLSSCLNNISTDFVPVWVREVTFPPDAKIWEMQGKYKADKFILSERVPLIETLAELPWSEKIIHYIKPENRINTCQLLTQNPRIDQSVLLTQATVLGDINMVKIVLSGYQHHSDIRIRYALEEATTHHFDDIVKLLIEFGWINPAAEDCVILEFAAIHGHLDIVERLIVDHFCDPSVRNNRILILAIQHGRLEIVNRLLAHPRVDACASNNLALRSAVIYRHIHIVNRLLEIRRVDPTSLDNEAICAASQYGYLDIVARLLQDDRVDPSAKDNTPIRRAVQGQHVGVVRLLLADPRVDPSVENNETLQSALLNNNLAIIELLLADPRIKPTAGELNDINRLRTPESNQQSGRALLRRPVGSLAHPTF